MILVITCDEIIVLLDAVLISLYDKKEPYEIDIIF